MILLPKVVCPLCWPAYTAVLGALGIGFMDYGPAVPWLIAIFLAFTVGGLGRAALRTKQFGPPIVGTAGAASIVLGAFTTGGRNLALAGAVILLFACAWTMRATPRRHHGGGTIISLAGGRVTHTRVNRDNLEDLENV